MSDPHSPSAKDELRPQQQNRVEVQPEQSVVPFDENLLERARTQWQFGDWQSLASIDRDTMQHHPDRAELALLAAAGRLQTSRDAEARQMIRLALDWGISRHLVSRILIAGVHNSLGRAAAIAKQHNRALRHFELAVVTSHIGGDKRLLSQARAREQFEQIQRLTLRLIMPANDTAGTSQAEAVSPESDYIFTVRLRLDGSTPVPLGFAASNKQWIKIHRNILYYQTEPGRSLYLISSPDGNFQNPPKKAQIPIAPDTNYLLRCELIHEGNTKPVIWVFQYDAENKVDSRSVPLINGSARFQFKTKLETESVAIGIRLGGKEKIDLNSSIFLSKSVKNRNLKQN